MVLVNIKTNKKYKENGFCFIIFFYFIVFHVSYLIIFLNILKENPAKKCIWQYQFVQQKIMIINNKNNEE